MILPSTEWIRFSTDSEVLSFMKSHGLAAPSANWVKTLVYSGFYCDQPVRCSLVGHLPPSAAVIEVSGNLHCINIDHLKDMQRGNSVSATPTQYVVLDIETTGLSRSEDSIIEIAAIRLRNGMEVESFDSLVRPDSILPIGIQELTGISPDMLIDAPSIRDVLTAFVTFIGADPLVGHNIKSFDIPFLQQKGRALGLSIENDIIDTLQLARKAYPELPCHRLNFLKETLFIDISVSHRALPDVLATAELYKICADKLMVAPSQAEDVSEKPAPEKMKVSGILSGMMFVLTGTLSLPREEIGQIIEDSGGMLSGSVSSRTTYVVAGIAPGSKLDKAKSLGIKILTEDDLYTLLDGATPESESRTLVGVSN